MSTIDLRDAFHTLRLATSSQKYCGITPYYGSPTYHYLRMGMGMSVSPQIWQQFVDLVFQDDLIKRKQNFDIIMDDTFIHSTTEEFQVDDDKVCYTPLKDKCEAIQNLDSTDKSFL